MMIVNAWMMANHKMIMTTMSKNLETKSVDHLELEDLGIVIKLKVPKDQ